jgi:hypothetical protein
MRAAAKHILQSKLLTKEMYEMLRTCSLANDIDHIYVYHMAYLHVLYHPLVCYVYIDMNESTYMAYFSVLFGSARQYCTQQDYA